MFDNSTVCVIRMSITLAARVIAGRKDNDMSESKLFCNVLEETIAACATDQVGTADELMSLILDIQEHGGEHFSKFDECIASLLIAGAVAKMRSIEYSRKAQAAKVLTGNRDRYNAAVASDPTIVLDPKRNATLMLAFGLIGREQYEKIVKSLDGASASVQTHTVTTTDAKAKVA